MEPQIANKPCCVKGFTPLFLCSFNINIILVRVMGIAEHIDFDTLPLIGWISESDLLERCIVIGIVCCVRGVNFCPKEDIWWWILSWDQQYLVGWLEYNFKVCVIFIEVNLLGILSYWFFASIWNLSICIKFVNSHLKRNFFSTYSFFGGGLE